LFAFQICFNLGNAEQIGIKVRRQTVEKTGSQNIQDAFLNTVRRERATVTIHLLHGSILTGRLKSFDKFSVLLDVGGQDFLIFKHAIATVTGSMQTRRAEGEQQPPQSRPQPQPPPQNRNV
jgi:host factor-I protein